MTRAIVLTLVLLFVSACGKGECLDAPPADFSGCTKSLASAQDEYGCPHATATHDPCDELDDSDVEDGLSRCLALSYGEGKETVRLYPTPSGSCRYMVYVPKR
jgi:hypothetical protein